MFFNHSVSDLVSRIRNGYMSKKSSVVIPVSTLRENILTILKDEGFILGFSKIENNNKYEFNVSLNYRNNRPAMNEISVVSKPGRRVYSQFKDLPVINNGLGMTIISSSKGVIPDHKARELKVGGEILIKIF